MRKHIDWITFTLPMFGVTESPDDYAAAVEHAFISTFGETLVSAAFGGEWSRKEFSRAPYADAWSKDAGNVTLFANPVLTHCCVEISGQGCENLIAAGLLEKVLQRVTDRLTRIDVAIDIETSTQPAEFVAVTKHAKMRSSGYQKSASGETCYVGSKDSERYARVYRYYEPHPRAHLLRVEHVFRREHAKVVARAILDSGMDNVAVAAGEAFGWRHSDWNTEEAEFIDLSVVKSETAAGGTVFWLLKQVAPAFKRLVDDGTIVDPEEFLRRYFLSPDKDA